MKKYYVTNKQIKEAREMLNKKGLGYRTKKCPEPTEQEDIELLKELKAVEMIHTYIAYNDWTHKDEWVNDEYMQSYRKELGVDKLQILIDETLKMVATIHRGVFCDPESGYYNSIVWKDD